MTNPCIPLDRSMATVVVTMAAASTIACSVTQPRTAPAVESTYRRSRGVPQWVTRRPDIPGQFVAVGIASGSASLEEGQQRASRAAVAEIVAYLGIHTEVLFAETTTLLAMQVTEQVRGHGAAHVSAGRTVEMYYEDHQELEDGRPARVFDVYVLVSVPLSELEQERARIKQQIADRHSLAAKILREGRQAREAGQIASALGRWLHLLASLSDHGEPTSFTLNAESEIARLIDDLEIVAVPVQVTALPARVQCRVRLRQGDQLLPVANIPIRFRFDSGGGDADARGVTDEKGLAGSKVRSIDVHGGRVVLVAEVDVPRLLGVDARGAPGATVTSALERLAHKRAEIIVVGFGDLRARAAGDRTAASGGRGGTRGVHRGEKLVGVELLAGQKLIYAPPGGPQKCVAFVLEITGSAAARAPRRPLNLTLVLDGSGSMEQQGKMDYLKTAAKLLVQNLAPVDVFSLVTYASEVKVVRPAGTVSDPTLLGHTVDMMLPSGTTNLGGGLIEGIRQAETYHGDGMLSRVILISDGLANEGVTDASMLARYAARAADVGISVTAVGLGQEFDEKLLMAVANQGQGNYYYVDDPSTIPEFLSAEMNGLAAVLAQNVNVRLELSSDVRFVNSLGIPYRRTERGISFRVGQLVAGQRIRIAFQLELPAGEPGTHRFGTASVTYDDPGDATPPAARAFGLAGVYTRHEHDAQSSMDMDVNRYVHMLAIIDSMLLAREGQSRRAIEEVLQYIAQERPKLRAWLERRDDQQMTSLGEMLDHCFLVLKQELADSEDVGSARGENLAKEISYKLYRLRHHAIWE